MEASENSAAMAQLKDLKSRLLGTDLEESDLDDVQVLNTGRGDEADIPDTDSEAVAGNQSFFSSIVDNIPKAEAALNGVSPEEEDKKVEEAASYKFPEEEVRAAMHGSIKKEKYSKVYDIGSTTTIIRDPRDYETGILNLLTAQLMTKGDKRTNVRVIDSYIDTKSSQTVPGGRLEEVFYFNPDYDREVMRAVTALMVVRLGDDFIHEPLRRGQNGVEDLKARINVLEEYSTGMLDALYNKVVGPFTQLMEEAAKRLINF